MRSVAFEEEALSRLRAAAAGLDVETCAVGFVAPAGSANGVTRHLVREFDEVPETAYLTRNSVAATLKAEYCLEVANRARANRLGIVFAHTHPGSHSLDGFSPVDDRGEAMLAPYFNGRVPNQLHLAAVVTERTVRCRMLGMTEPANVASIGRSIQQFTASTEESALPDRFNRQVMAFGTEGQSVLRSTTVAIVGLGGTGSIVAQQLAHLGIREFFLVDPDNVSESNLNRLVGAVAVDVGRAKVEVAKRSIQAVHPDATVRAIVGNVIESAIAHPLRSVDFIFLCTDSMASRAVLNQLAYQYLIPCIDMGVAIKAHMGVVDAVVGRVQMLAPGLPCLVCADWIDGNQVRQEMMNEEQRRRDPYFLGEGVAQPAVISLNGVVVSAAVSMFLSALTSFPGNARMLHYDAIRGALRPAVMNPNPNCIVCSRHGALARGETWELPVRHEHASS